MAHDRIGRAVLLLIRCIEVGQYATCIPVGIVIIRLHPAFAAKRHILTFAEEKVILRYRSLNPLELWSGYKRMLAAILCMYGQCVSQSRFPIARLEVTIRPIALSEPSGCKCDAYRIPAGMQIAADVILHIIHAVPQLLNKRSSSQREFALAVIGCDRRKHVARYARAVYV